MAAFDTIKALQKREIDLELSFKATKLGYQLGSLKRTDWDILKADFTLQEILHIKKSLFKNWKSRVPGLIEAIATDLFAGFFDETTKNIIVQVGIENRKILCSLGAVGAFERIKNTPMVNIRYLWYFQCVISLTNLDINFMPTWKGKRTAVSHRARRINKKKSVFSVAIYDYYYFDDGDNFGKIDMAIMNSLLKEVIEHRKHGTPAEKILEPEKLENFLTDPKKIHRLTYFDSLYNIVKLHLRFDEGATWNEMTELVIENTMNGIEPELIFWRCNCGVIFSEENILSHHKRLICRNVTEEKELMQNSWFNWNKTMWEMQVKIRLKAGIEIGQILESGNKYQLAYHRKNTFQYSDHNRSFLTQKVHEILADNSKSDSKIRELLTLGFDFLDIEETLGLQKNVFDIAEQGYFQTVLENPPPVSRKKCKASEPSSRKKCSRRAVLNEKYCPVHLFTNSRKRREIIDDIVRKNLFERFFEIILLDIVARELDYTLPQIFGWIKERVAEVGVRVESRGKQVRKWFVGTQKAFGHPVEIIELKYRHVYGKTPYLTIWKKGLSPTHAEKLFDYIEKKPKATALQIHQDTGIPLTTINKWMIGYGIKKSRPKKDIIDEILEDDGEDDIDALVNSILEED